MAYFVVEPGRSFHSVQEVFCDRPRLSIQGWYYHAKELPKHMEQASLSQLKKNNVGEHDFEGDFMPMIATVVDNDNDNGTDTDTMEHDGTNTRGQGFPRPIHQQDRPTTIIHSRNLYTFRGRFIRSVAALFQSGLGREGF